MIPPDQFQVDEFRWIQQGHGGLILSGHSDRGPLRHVGVYLVLADYAGQDPLGRDDDEVRHDMVRLILATIGKEDLLLGLNVLSRVWNREEERSQVRDVLRQNLSDKSRRLLDNALRPGKEQRILVVRQGILEGFRTVLRYGRDVPTQRSPEAAALMLTHSVLSRTNRTNSTEQFGGLPADVSVPMCINQYFYGPDDDVSRFDRVLRLWRDFGPSQESILGGRTPGDLLREATGLEIEDLIVMGFAIWAHHENWRLGQPQYLDVTLHPAMDIERWTTFLKLVADTSEGFSRQLKDLT